MTLMPTAKILLPLLTAAILCTAACGPGLYDLPTPPPQDQWINTGADPAAEERASQRRYLAARAALLQFYRALSQEDWDAAWEMMSSETQNFLNFASKGKDGKASLDSGTLEMPDGTSVEFDPVELFVIRDLRTMEDDHEGKPQAETANRKEIFVISSDNRVNKVVLIFETGQWRVHRTKAF